MLNEKIVKSKLDRIMKIMDMDGGCTLIEGLGVLEYCKHVMIEHARASQIKPIEPIQNYESLKRKRIGDINV